MVNDQQQDPDMKQRIDDIDGRAREAAQKMDAAGTRRGRAIRELYGAFRALVDEMDKLYGWLDEYKRENEELRSMLENERAKKEAEQQRVQDLSVVCEQITTGLNEAADDEEQEASTLEATNRAVIDNLATMAETESVQDCRSLLQKVRAAVGDDSVSDEGVAAQPQSQVDVIEDAATSDNAEFSEGDEGQEDTPASPEVEAEAAEEEPSEATATTEAAKSKVA